MARITSRVTGRITVDRKAVVDGMSKAILEHIRRRTEARTDVSDSTFADYSPLYKMQLAAIGDPANVNMSMTGTMMKSIRLLRVEDKDGRVTLHFGPDWKRVTRPPRPPPWVFDENKTPGERSDAMDAWRRSRKTPSRSPPNAVLMMIIERGMHGKRPRRILGISPKGRPPIVTAIEKARIFRNGGR